MTTSPKNIAITVWFTAWLTLVAFLFESYATKDDQLQFGKAYKPYKLTMRIFPSIGIIATIVTYIVHSRSNYYNDRPWLTSESLFYGVAISVFGFFLNIGVFSSCISDALENVSISEINDCNDNVKIGELIVPIVAAAIAGGLWLYFSKFAKSTNSNPDRSIEGVWMFEKIYVVLLNLFLASLVGSIISYRERDCMEDANSDPDDIKTCNTVSGSVLLIFGVLLLAAFTLSFLKPVPSAAERQATRNRMSALGLLEWYTFLSFVVGFIIFFITSAIFNLCENDDPTDECIDFKNNSFLGGGIIMIVSLCVGVVLSFKQNNQNGPRLTSVPSHPSYGV